MPAPRPRTTRLLGGRGVRGRETWRGGGSSAVQAPTPARHFSGRFLVLTLVALLIVFLAAPTTKIYLEQRAEIAGIERAIADMQDEQASLEDRVDQWSDETYVRQQARDRLLYVMPGERSYLVVGADEMDGAVMDSSAAQLEAEKPAWVDALWQSVVASAYEDTRSAADARSGDAAEPGVPAEGQEGAQTPVPADGTEGTSTTAPTDGPGEPQDTATDDRGTAEEEATE